jgi:hypothetical protein
VTFDESVERDQRFGSRDLSSRARKPIIPKMFTERHTYKIPVCRREEQLFEVLRQTICDFVILDTLISSGIMKQPIWEKLKIRVIGQKGSCLPSS